MDRINIEQSKISVSIRDLVNGFTDTEELGVYAFGGNLNVRPAYQREFVYDDKKRALVIDSVASGIDLGKMYWSVNDDGSMSCLMVNKERFQFVSIAIMILQWNLRRESLNISMVLMRSRGSRFLITPLIL
jgi:hypothetical protein